LDLGQWNENAAFETTANGGIELPGDICCS
jgi:hypothetical protein